MSKSQRQRLQLTGHPGLKRDLRQATEIEENQGYIFLGSCNTTQTHVAGVGGRLSLFIFIYFTNLKPLDIYTFLFVLFP